MKRKRSRFYCIVLFAVLVLLPVPLWAGHEGHVSEENSKKNESQDVMVVTGQRLDDYIVDHPQLVTVLERGDIEAGNFLDLTEAIGSMLGVDVSQAGSTMQSRISIRCSSDSGAILVLVNGRPLNSSQYGSVELASLPIDTVRKVTVFKPPVPVWLGPGVTACAINIETRKSGSLDSEDKWWLLGKNPQFWPALSAQPWLHGSCPGHSGSG